MRKPTQLDLFPRLPPSRTSFPTARRDVPSITTNHSVWFDFPDSDAYAPRGIESVPAWLSLPTDEV